MSSNTERPNLRQLDKSFLAKLQRGDRFFHYAKKGDSRQSFDESPSAAYTLFSVIDLPTKDDVVIQGAFDLEEQKQSITRDELLSGEWWHIVEPG